MKKRKENTISIKNLLFLFGINFLVLGCSNKLLNPIKNGTFGKEQSKVLKSDVYLFVYPKKSLDVFASEKCTIKIVKKIEEEYFILAEGKYEISYANLNECFVKEGEAVQRGKVIGTIGTMDSLSKGNIEELYLRITVKDNKGNFLENGSIFK